MDSPTRSTKFLLPKFSRNSRGPNTSRKMPGGLTPGIGAVIKFNRFGQFVRLFRESEIEMQRYEPSGLDFVTA